MFISFKISTFIVTFVELFSIMLGMKKRVRLHDGAITRTKLNMFSFFNEFPEEWTSIVPEHSRNQNRYITDLVCGLGTN